jgi:hypothetical protein
MLLHLKFPTEEGCWGLWFPLFLIYPLFLAISLLAAPFLLLGSLLLWPTGRAKRVLLMLPYAWDVVFKIRGLLVDLRRDGRDVLINFV